MKDDLVTTIIPTYKRNDTLIRAIDSVINQTYQNIEIIVVDDNNPDSLYRKKNREIMKTYSHDSRINYIQHDKNLNGAAARNTGIKNSHGNFITFLDDDDFFSPDRFEKLIPLFNQVNENVGVISSGFKYIRKNKIYKTGYATKTKNVLIDLLSSQFSIGSGSNFILKRSVFDLVEGFDTSFKRHQDIEFLVRVAEKYDFYISDDFLLYIQLDSEFQNKTSIENLIDIKKQFLNKYNYLLKKYNQQEIFNKQQKNLIDIILYNGEEKKYKEIIYNYILKLDVREKIKFKIHYLYMKIKFIIRSMIY